jgi:hypothetical protein
MTQINAFVEAAKQALLQIPLSAVAIEQDLRTIRADGGSIELEVFKADTFKKIVFCTIVIDETGVLESTAMAWPDEDHDFPILWCNFTIVPEVMNVPIFDFIPMMDIIDRPEYATRYVEGISDLKSEALDILGETVLNKAVDLPSRTVYALSPYKLIPMVTQEGIELVPKVTSMYIAAYLKLVQGAGPVPAQDRPYYLHRRQQLQALMKANDPGYPFMVDVFGEETTHRVFDQVF